MIDNRILPEHSCSFCVSDRGYRPYKEKEALDHQKGTHPLPSFASQENKSPSRTYLSPRVLLCIPFESQVETLIDQVTYICFTTIQRFRKDSWRGSKKWQSESALRIRTTPASNGYIVVSCKIWNAIGCTSTSETIGIIDNDKYQCSFFSITLRVLQSLTNPQKQHCCARGNLMTSVCQSNVQGDTKPFVLYISP